MTNSERVALQCFFRTLFATVSNGYIEIRPFRSDGTAANQLRSFIPVHDSDNAARRVLSLGRRFHAFFGVCTRTEEARSLRRGTNHYLRELPALWADLDAKSFGGLAQAKASLRCVSLEPSILVFTGHGYHAYWLLEEPARLDDGNRSVLQSALRSLQTIVFRADDVSDLTRVLRVPYSHNIKDPEHPIQAKIISLQETRYAVDDLLEVIPWEDSLEPGRASSTQIVEERFDGLDAVLASDFVAHCRENAHTLSEPLWYALITNLIGFRGGRQMIHILSQPHPRYTYEGTERKIAHALRDAPGPHTYQYIANHGFRSRDVANPDLVSPASRAFHRSPAREILTTTRKRGGDRC